MNLENEIFELSLENIMPNRFQPREIFEDESLMELAESIKQHGIIQPIIVRKIGDKYEIIAGERRYRASKLAGQKTIPAIIRNIDDKEVAKVALLENLQRRDLSPIEEAKTYQTILKLDNLTQDELANNLGKSQSAVANKLRLLNLDEEVQTALLNNEISERHARSLLNLSKEKQKELLDRVIKERLTVKQLDDIIADNKPKEKEETNQIDETPVDNQEFVSQEETEKEEFTKPKNNIFDSLRVDNKDTTKTNIKLEPKEELDTIQKEEKENLESIINTIDNDISKPKTNEQENISPINENGELKYDLRFAINNFRQAIQNTEKFGFKVKTEEFENQENYQLIITIKKKG